MPLEIGLWRVDGAVPAPVTASGMPLESRLEHLIEADPRILGEPLLLIGRQVATAYGSFIDLLAIDGDGGLHVLELKRDRTREVVAQALDYGSWVAGLSHDHVIGIFADYRPGAVFEEVFADRFGVAPPEELNTAHRLTVVASAVDGATERIITYLNTGFGEWFSRTLRGLPLQARVFVCIPKIGYVGVGTVTGTAQRFTDAVLTIDGAQRRLAELQLHGRYRRGHDDDQTAEYVVPVAWTKTMPRDRAVWQRGMFANQNSACKLRNRFTIDVLATAFGLDAHGEHRPDDTHEHFLQAAAR